MNNTLRQTSYVVPAEIGAPVAAIVALQNTFEAMFPTLKVRPAPEGPGLLFAVSDNNSCTNLSIGVVNLNICVHVCNVVMHVYT